MQLPKQKSNLSTPLRRSPVARGGGGKEGVGWQANGQADGSAGGHAGGPVSGRRQSGEVRSQNNEISLIPDWRPLDDAAAAADGGSICLSGFRQICWRRFLMLLSCFRIRLSGVSFVLLVNIKLVQKQMTLCKLICILSMSALFGQSLKLGFWYVERSIKYKKHQ